VDLTDTISMPRFLTQAYAPDHLTPAYAKTLKRHVPPGAVLIRRAIFITIGAAYIAGLFIPLMNNDSAHHANIALRMHETGDFVSLIDRGKDYLDKPHLLFWLSALSYKIFGVNSFAYKFPSLLFSLLAVYSTYKLAAILYTRRIAELSAIFLCTSYAFFLANNDVRMDALLTGSIIFSIWQLINFNLTKSLLSLILSALGLSLGFATKGIIGIVMPLMALFFFIAYRRSWNDLFDKRWLLCALLAMGFLAPVFYCFYVQFDLHPEKIIRGTTGNSGIAFLIFGQSIQRYSGTGWGTNNGNDYLFFVHTFLWAFLPWSIAAGLGLWKSIVWQLKNKFIYSRDHQLFIPATIVTILLILSASGFKLPHYLNILFPLFSICAAVFVNGVDGKWQKSITIIQIVIVIITLFITFALNFWVFPVHNIYVVCVSAVLGVAMIYQTVYKKESYIVLTLLTTSMLYFSLNFHFYPNLLKLQAGNVLAQSLKEKKLAEEPVYYLEGHEVSNSFDFHLGRIIPPRTIHDISSLRHPWIIYTGLSGLEELNKYGLSYQVIDSAVNARISKPDENTLNPDKRKAIKTFHYLIRMNSFR
jgi:4-amino-4-deoxy-L-arabinose transferase-like glycosyltransferase